MTNEQWKVLEQSMDQLQAAALAVLMSDIRETMNEEFKASSEGQPSVDAKEVYDFLLRLENCAIQSIRANDGEVVRHLGTAAKQMNPLLTH